MFQSMPRELVWEGKYDVLENQNIFLQNKPNVLKRLRGKVEVIVTDSPIFDEPHLWPAKQQYRILQCVSSKRVLLQSFAKRGDHFKRADVQNLERKVRHLTEKDNEYVKRKNIYFGVYSHNVSI